MTDRPDIPEEAVEAAARAEYDDWSTLGEAERNECRAAMRRALQAAAPALRNQGAAEERERIKRRFFEDSRIARGVKEKLNDICEEG